MQPYKDMQVGAAVQWQRGHVVAEKRAEVKDV